MQLGFVVKVLVLLTMAKADGNPLVTKKAAWAFVSDRRRDDMRQPKPFDQGQGAVTNHRQGMSGQ